MDPQPRGAVTPGTEISPDRLAATEYAVFHDPERTTRTPFGWFTHNPDFPFRHDANQLFDVRCRPEDVDALLAELDRCYAGTGRPFRKLCFHDPETARHLVPTLERRGWSVRRTWMMVHRHPPRRAPNPAVEVRVVPFHDPDGPRAAVALADGGTAEAMRYRQHSDPRLGGELLVGFLDGQPAGRTGWFVVGGIARHRPVRTRALYRNRGVATTLLLHIQRHPAVRAADALTIFVNEDGPIPLYEQLGFVKSAPIWSALRRLSTSL
jgi:hypothetical protein